MATDFNSKYTGEQVEELLDQVANGGTGGGESDIYIWEFNGSLEDGASGTIEREVFEKLAEAKSLWLKHEESYTVCNFHVGDSSSLFMLFTTIQQDVMSNCAIGIDGETLQYNVAGYEISIQEAIDDLDDIRSGAEKGATALQEVPSEYVTALNGKVDKVDGKQLSTEDFTTILKQKLDGLSNYDDTTISQAVEKLRTDLDALVSGDTTTAIKTFNEVIAFLDGISDMEDLSGIIASIEQQIAGKMDSVTLAKVATSGSYDDLTNKPTIPAEQVNADWNATSGKAQILNKPTIPSAVTESTVSGWGFTKNTGTYTKPSTGIPKTDLASGVQSSLEKADKAQPALVSGENIKTINGKSILGSGNIVIGGGASGGGVYAEVNHGTNDTTFTLTPNTFHVWDEVASLYLTLGSETSGVANEYIFQFTSGSTATTLSLPSDLKWANDASPTIVENMTYQVSILKGLASVLEFSNEALSVPIVFYVNGTPYDAMSNMTWEEWVNSEYNANEEFFLDGNDINYWIDKAEDEYRYVYSLTLGVVTKSDIIIPEHSYLAD